MHHMLSLAQHTVPSWSPVQMIVNAKQIGFQAVGIRTIAQGITGETVYDLTADHTLYEKTKRTLDETGMVLNDIDLIALNDNTRISEYRSSLKAAAGLGARGVVCSIWTSNTSHALHELDALCELAGECGMLVHLEFVTWSSIKNLCQAREVLDQLKKPNLKILLDMIHTHRSRVSLKEIAACPPDLFQLIHICDAPNAIPNDDETLIQTCRSERLYPGEGEIPISQILQYVINTKSVLGIEIPNVKKTQTLGAYTHAKQCLEYFNDYLTKT